MCILASGVSGCGTYGAIRALVEDPPESSELSPGTVLERPVQTIYRKPTPSLRDDREVIKVVAVPLAVWPIWQALGLWPGLVAALCLSAMAPGIISAATTATFLRLDSSLALLLTLFTNFLVPFTLPPLALGLLGLDLHIGALDLSLRLATIVAIAAAGAFLIRRRIGPRMAEAAPHWHRARGAGRIRSS